MKHTSRSIALVGFDPVNDAELVTALRDSDGVGVEEVSSSLSAINGHASALAGKHDVILFRTDAASGTDIGALEEIRANASDGAMIIALTQADTSLEMAHKLARAGVDKVLPDTISAIDLRDQVTECLARATQADTAGQSRTGRIISVAQARGGVGSTTVAVNLADSLLGTKGMLRKTATHRVAIVDLDLQFGAVAGFLDTPPSEGLFQLAEDQSIPDSTFLEQSMTTLPSGLAVLAAPSRFAPADALKSQQVQAILETLAGEYDFVVVDLPRLLVDWIAPVLEMSDRMLIVTDTTVPSIQQARRLIDFYKEDNIALKIEIVVNREKKPVIKARHHAEAEKVLDLPLKAWLPEDIKTAREAVDRGVPVSSVSGRSPLARGLRKLGHDMIRAPETTTHHHAKTSG